MTGVREWANRRATRLVIDPDTSTAITALSRSLDVHSTAVLASAVATVLFRCRRDTWVLVHVDHNEIALELSDDVRFQDVLTHLGDHTQAVGGSGGAGQVAVEVVAEEHGGRSTLVVTGNQLPWDGDHRWGDALWCVITHAVREPATRLGALRMLSDDAMASLVAEGDNVTTAFTEPTSPEVSFGRVAAAAPDLIALVTDTGNMTYGALNSRVERFAAVLAERGIGPERPVALYLERSADLVVALLAVLRCGAPYVPLDHRMPNQRIREVLLATQAALVVGDSRIRDTAEAAGVRVVSVQYPPGAAVPAPTGVGVPDNAAYIYFTSGSTGKPKGVVTDRRCAAIRVDWTARRYGLGPGATVLHKTPLIFDVAIIEILAPLSVGSAVRIAAPRTETDVVYLSGVLSREDITWVHFVPSMLRVFVSGIGDTVFPKVRWVLCTGEAVPAHLARRARNAFIGAEFHNLYGQTETSEVTSWEGLPGDSGYVPIGTQVNGYRLFVLDLALRPVPAGVPGEIYVAGVGGLARGYQSDPSLTAQRFVANPYPVGLGERMYRSGDLGIRQENGVITFLHRTDDQTKIGGARVEPAEVEVVIGSFPQVRQCAVVVRKDTHGDNELVAYLVGETSTSRQVREWTSARLAAYMVPGAFVWLDELPFTDSGKLDRAALPDPVSADHVIGSAAADEPVSSVEAELCVIWANVLGQERVHPTDDFFSLHGNSLKAAALLARISSTFATRLTIEDLYDHPDVRSFATMLTQNRPNP